MAAKRRRWHNRQTWLNPERSVFIDETGAKTTMARLRGRALSGQCLHATVPWGHWKTTTFVASLRVDKDHKAAIEAWEAKRGGIKEKIRQLSKAGKSAHEQEDALRDLEHDKPEPPRVPRLIYGDATPEALKWNLAKGWPSGGVVSSEAGLAVRIAWARIPLCAIWPP